MPPADREIRLAPSQADFDKVVFEPKTIPASGSADWKRLAQKRYSHQFYPSAGSRLTPSSLNFPCVYIASSLKTTVAEVWGDRLYAAREAKKKIFSIPAVEAATWAYLDVKVVTQLLLCDLTDADTRGAVGIEGGTLNCPKLAVPQAWAEVIANHPLRVDGIKYRSRHTDEVCVVAWSRGDGSVEAKLQFTLAGEFDHSTPAYELAKTMNIGLSFP